MQSKLHRNEVCQSVELLFLVPMLSQLTIPISLLIFLGKAFIVYACSDGVFLLS